MKTIYTSSRSFPNNLQTKTTHRIINKPTKIHHSLSPQHLRPSSNQSPTKNSPQKRPNATTKLNYTNTSLYHQSTPTKNRPLTQQLKYINKKNLRKIKNKTERNIQNNHFSRTPYGYAYYKKLHKNYVTDYQNSSLPV